MSERKEVLTGKVVETKAVALANTNVFADEGFNLEVDLTTAKSQFCTLVSDDNQVNAKIFNATNNPQHRLADFINKTIDMAHVYIEVVTCVNQETGEAKECPRVVIIDKDLNGYACVSIGIYSAIKKLINRFGMPETWEKPIKVEVKQITKGARQMLSLNLAV